MAGAGVALIDCAPRRTHRPPPAARVHAARSLYFEARHAGSALTETEMGGITHPNQYFDLSMKFYAELHAAQPGEAGAQPGSKPTESAGAVAAGAADAGAPVPMEVS